MGIVRLYLALSVVVWHMLGRAQPPFIQGGKSVILFYMISGFYMAMVLNEKYVDVATFYFSRFLRLYPIYFIVLVATVVLIREIPPTMFEAEMVSQTVPTWHKFLVVLSNILIVGQDFLPFLGIGQNGINLIRLGWSLAIEIGFYAVAPFIVRRNILSLILLTAATLLIRASLPGADEATYWRYYFPPSVWCFFMMGCISYRFWSVASHELRKRCGWVALIALPILGYFCGVTESVDYDSPSLWVFYLSFAVALPVIFSVTRSSWLDSFIGDLAYPVYVLHILVMNYCNGHYNMSEAGDIVAILIASAVLLASTAPIEWLRKSIWKARPALAPTL